MKRIALRVRLIAIDDVRLTIPRAKRRIVSVRAVCTLRLGWGWGSLIATGDDHMSRSAFADGIVDAVSPERSSEAEAVGAVGAASVDSGPAA